jgi:hypothetical protein
MLIIGNVFAGFNTNGDQLGTSTSALLVPRSSYETLAALISFS